ncbi:MAG: fibronectin type III domain-containing protein [Planctomycetes bacterium]|nr:fibronectin type III domain-containing protein [Planctomycetota bacterium]
MKKIILTILVISASWLTMASQGCPQMNKEDLEDILSGSSGDIPLIPSFLSANAVSSSQIDLFWQDNSTNEDGFKIEQSLDGEEYYHLGTVNTGVTSYIVHRLTSNTRYYYRVSAYNSSGNSGYSTASAVTNSSGDTWKTSVIDSKGVNKVDGDNCITVDSNGKIHISYIYYGQYYWLKYATNITGTWNTFTIEKAWLTTSIISDINNKIHICYASPDFKGGADSLIKYAVKTPSNWEISVINKSFNNIHFSDIALSETVAPSVIHIVYRDADDYALKYATNETGSWNTFSLDNTGQCESPSVAVDSSNKIHVVYTSRGVLKYATNNFGAWMAFNISSEQARFPSMAIDSNNKLHISYLSGCNSGSGPLKYATNAGGSWVVSTIEQAESSEQHDLGNAGWSISIALDQNNKAHISYYGNKGELKYATNKNGNWVRIIIDDIGSNRHTKSTSIAVDSDNKIHISYYDEVNNNLKYATNK